MSRVHLDALRSHLDNAIKGSPFDGKVYFAGGCVRDHLLLRQTNDFDLTVALPDGGIALANYLHQSGLAMEPVIYAAFGTAMVYFSPDDSNRYKLELVMTRRESYRPSSRKPSVEFGTLEEDVIRRDFTVNSLLMTVDDGEILDLTGKGRDDLSNGVIRTVSDPKVIFAQDPLRLLRAVRYATDLGFIIEPETWDQIGRAATSLKEISPERIAEEMNRIIVLDNAVQGLEMLQETGLLRQVLPEVDILAGLAQNKYHYLDVFEHTLEVVRHCRSDLRLRWAALLHDLGKEKCLRISAQGTRQFIGHERTGASMAAEVLRRFSLPNGTIDLICRVIKDHMRFKQGGEQGQLIKDATLRRMIQSYGIDIYLLLELIQADNMTHHPDYRLPEQVSRLSQRVENLTEEMEKHRFSLTGMDIIHEFSIQSSPLVGNLLKLAENEWLENPYLTREELIEIIRENLK